MSLRAEVLRDRIATLRRELTDVETRERVVNLDELAEVQREYVSSGDDRRRAAATALARHNHPVAELAQAAGLSARGLYLMARRADHEPYVFAGDELEELRHLAARYAEAEQARVDMVLRLRELPAESRPKLADMARVMGISSEGVRQIVKAHSSGQQRRRRSG